MTGSDQRQSGLRIGLGLLGAALLAQLAACGGAEKKANTEEPTSSSVAATAPAATATPNPLKLLTTTPDQVPVGGEFTMTGEGLPSGKALEFMWSTVGGKYDTAVKLGSIEFHGPVFEPARMSLGRATTDASGHVTATFKVPEDFGEIHDIFAMADGKDVARGGIRVPRTVTISPTSGPVGTVITIQAKGLGSAKFDNTVGVRWDNKYTGFIAAITTRGTAVAQVRAAGPVGTHVIDVGDASAAVPYLNAVQTPRKYKLPQFRFAFTVTADGGPPPMTIDWPDEARVATGASTPLTPSNKVVVTQGVTASLSSLSGPILSKSNLRATGLPADTTVDLVWKTIVGNDLAGWQPDVQPLSKVTVGKDGSLSANVDIPEGLGGWHSILVVAGEKVLAEVPYRVDRSLVGVTPMVVKAGQPFKVEIKGVGWTELDNGVSVTYDNNFVGYACGFGSGGYVAIELTATGGPGTHLIDLYPMIYNRGNAVWTWDYEIPVLTYAQDHPGLALGYKLPTFRLAVTVVE